jgi:alpha-glucoside transport system substrate-binding protein
MKTLHKLLSALAVIALVLTACGTPTTEAPPPTTAPVATSVSTGPSGKFLDRAYAGEFKGTVVTATGPFTDEDAVKFDATMAAFEQATGIDVQYEGTKEFEATISARVDAGDAPDIVDFPQPGLLANFVKAGKVVDLSQHLDTSALGETYIQSWLDMGTMQGPNGPIMAGVWERVNGKSLVWYPKDDFEAAGYTIPQTWEELIALGDQIVADGDTPWCIGIESGAATGWAATDWMEEIMLRTTSLENYDKWTSGQLPFNSPEVKHAAEVMSEIWLNDDYVYGGRAAIATTFFGDAPLPMFEDPPKCWLHKQGNFITSFFPADAQPGVDYDFFYLPPIDEAYGKPVLVAGDIWAAFDDRPEVMAVMEYFTKGEHLKGWIQSGGAIAPHLDSDLSWYGDEVTRGVAEIILNASSVRFDGSDLMPGAVGAGSFWSEMTSYISGKSDLDTALADIDATWPGSTTAAAKTFLDRAYAGEFKGTVVTATGPFTDEDAVKFDATMAAFEQATGIDVQYEGTKEFEATISARVDAGDAPDIVDFPQPGLLANFVKAGKVVDLSQHLDTSALGETYIQSWLDMGTMQGPNGPIMAGVWERVNGKSLVWYPKDDFEAAGYTIPQTWEELIALGDQIVADGDTPWCIGIESGAATGWAATDWMEEIMLRTTSLENYDKWTSGQLPFNSPEVKHAAEVMSEIWLNDDYVYGGRAAIATTFFGDAPLPMFEDPPKCWLHKQGNFITSFFPADAQPGVDYDFFYLPPIDEAYGKPVLVAGDIWAAFDDRPEVMAVMEYFTKGEHLKGWIQSGGAIAPHLDSDLSWYGDEVTRGVAEIILNASSVRFDGSDLMPGAVGAGSFWSEMTSYISGKSDLDTALANIDATWPK